MARPPADAIEITTVAKQWMWKFQHPDGKPEINDLHVPLGRAVKMRMISEDVIHSFYVPAFRVKQDVLPGRYTTVWFEATRLGEYHLFCAEYCGAKHSEMKGKVIVLEPSEYQDWLAGGERGDTPIEAGRKLFEERRCDQCHKPAGEPGRGPPLEDLFGAMVPLTNGRDGRGRRNLPPRIDPAAAGEAAGRISAADADLRGTDRRRRAAAPDRLHQVALQTRQDRAPAMTTAPLIWPRRNYLTAAYTVRSWLLTVDHKRIALLYLAAITFFFVDRRTGRDDRAVGVDDAAGRSRRIGNVQQAVHDPRRDHGLLLPDSRGAGRARATFSCR